MRAVLIITGIVLWLGFMFCIWALLAAAATMGVEPESLDDVTHIDDWRAS